MKNVRRSLQLSRYRAAHADFAKSAMTGVLRAAATESDLAANRRSVAGQLTVLNACREAATIFAGVRASSLSSRALARNGSKPWTG